MIKSEGMSQGDVSQMHVGSDYEEYGPETFQLWISPTKYPGLTYTSLISGLKRNQVIELVRQGEYTDGPPVEFQQSYQSRLSLQSSNYTYTPTGHRIVATGLSSEMCAQELRASQSSLASTGRSKHSGFEETDPQSTGWSMDSVFESEDPASPERLRHSALKRQDPISTGPSMHSAFERQDPPLTGLLMHSAFERHNTASTGRSTHNAFQKKDPGSPGPSMINAFIKKGTSSTGLSMHSGFEKQNTSSPSPSIQSALERQDPVSPRLSMHSALKRKDPPSSVPSMNNVLQRQEPPSTPWSMYCGFQQPDQPKKKSTSSMQRHNICTSTEFGQSGLAVAECPLIDLTDAEQREQHDNIRKGKVLSSE